MSDLGQHSIFLTIDELGIDPLRDKSIDAIMEVKSFEFYTVRSDEQKNAPLLAFNVYRNETYWWHILVYNKLDDMFELKVGMQLRIPDLNEMTTRLQAALSEDKTVRTVSI